MFSISWVVSYHIFNSEVVSCNVFNSLVVVSYQVLQRNHGIVINFLSGDLVISQFSHDKLINPRNLITRCTTPSRRNLSGCATQFKPLRDLPLTLLYRSKDCFHANSHQNQVPMNQLCPCHLPKDQDCFPQSYWHSWSKFDQIWKTTFVRRGLDTFPLFGCQAETRRKPAWAFSLHQMLRSS